jgi:hypothetical protein
VFVEQAGRDLRADDQIVIAMGDGQIMPEIAEDSVRAD